MQQTTEREIKAIEQLSVAQLLEKYQTLFGKPATSRHHRHLMRQIARGLQVAAEGGLTEKASRGAASLLDLTDLSVAAATRRTSKNRLSPNGPVTSWPPPGVRENGSVVVPSWVTTPIGKLLA